MFTKKEAELLKSYLESTIETLRNQLNIGSTEGVRRQQVEDRLISLVSAYNKLNYTKPKNTGISKQARLLIIDDVESLRNVHRHYFLECGFRHIEMAEDGLKAFKAMRRALSEGKPFDLVVSDWEMPRVSGLDLLKKVRVDKDLWGTPFFLITALGDKPHILSAINAGATGYMVKPLSQIVVNQKFAEYLN
ncbi:MAG: response regulator [Aestuariibacter sp.]